MRHRVNVIAGAALFLLSSLTAYAQGAGGITIFGNVSLPDGTRAQRVIVKIESQTGLQRETYTDDLGRYSFMGMSNGRYRLTVTNPNDDSQVSDPTVGDTLRSFAGRLQVDLALKYPPKVEIGPGGNKVLNVAEASQKIPKNARKAFDDGMKLKVEKKSEQAIEKFTEAIGIYPTYFQALSERGQLRLEGMQLDAAAEDFDRSLKINPDYSPALHGAGMCQLEKKNVEKALPYFDRVATLEPSNVAAQVMLGYVNMSLDRRDPARRAFEQAIKTDAKRSGRAYVYLAEVLGREGKFKEAADAIWNYLNLNPNAPDAEKLRSLEIQLRAVSVK